VPHDTDSPVVEHLAIAFDMTHMVERSATMVHAKLVVGTSYSVHPIKAVGWDGVTLIFPPKGIRPSSVPGLRWEIISHRLIFVAQARAALMRWAEQSFDGRIADWRSRQ